MDVTQKSRRGSVSGWPAGQKEAVDVQHRQPPFYHTEGGEAIEIFDGKRTVTAGWLTAEGVFIKRLRREHLLQRPVMAIAVQCEVLDELARRGCVKIRAEVEGQLPLEVSFGLFQRDGFLFDYGFGEQWALPLSRWTREDRLSGDLFHERGDVFDESSDAEIEQILAKGRAHNLAFLRRLPGFGTLRRVVWHVRNIPDSDKRINHFTLEMENGETVPLGAIEDTATFSERLDAAAGCDELDLTDYIICAAEGKEEVGTTEEEQHDMEHGNKTDFVSKSDNMNELPSPQPAATCHTGTVANHQIEKDGKNSRVIALPITEISANLLALTENWPKVAGNLLFYDNAGHIRILEKPEDLFAWMHEQGRVRWRDGASKDGTALVTRSEFMSHLRATVERYDAVEELPHAPALPDHYYTWREPLGYSPDGSYLDKLLSFFDNPESEVDAVLIRALFLAPCWGGIPGTRPAFAILARDRGHGKSTLADAVAAIYGGAIEVSQKEVDGERLIPRLLSPPALTKRVVRIDNAKFTLDSGQIEALITAREISGHRLYCGEAKRPNTLTYIITGNSLQLSRDLAERCFIIRLDKPSFRASWKEDVLRFCRKYRQQVIADIVLTLRQVPKGLPAEDRWGEFTQEVLGRCTPSPQAVIALTHARRETCDEEKEEAKSIRGILNQIPAEKVSLRPAGGVFVTTSALTDEMNRVMSTHLSSKRVKMMVCAHVDAGRLPDVEYLETAKGNGFVFTRE